MTELATHATRVREDAPAHRLEGRVFVAGASGHAGANLVRHLLREGVAVRVSDDPRGPALRGLDVERGASLAGCAYVLACDAEPREIERLLREAAGHGAARVVVVETDAPSDAGEEIVRDAATRGLDVVLVRAPRVVGPHDHTRSPHSEALVAHAHGTLKAFEDAGGPLVSARDLVEATLLALTRGRAGASYAVATEHLDAEAHMALFEEVTGRARPRRTLRGRIAGLIGSAPSRPAFDTRAARHELGFAPTGLRRAIHEAHADLGRRGLVPTRPGTTEPPLLERAPREAIRRASGS